VAKGTILRVERGLKDSPVEGLEALLRAHDLAPRNGHYLLDYGAALFDCRRPQEAISALKQVWMEEIQITPQDRIQAALLLSDIETSLGGLPDARGWLYRALSENHENVSIVQRLRQLDLRQSEAARLQAAAEKPAETVEEAVPEPGAETATPEVAPEATQPESGTTAPEIIEEPQVPAE
jgi:tetratricopeptide (TPR) repeat protein